MSKYKRAKKAYKEALSKAALAYAEARLEAALTLAEDLAKEEEE